jgi:hypothetical protein
MKKAQVNKIAKIKKEVTDIVTIKPAELEAVKIATPEDMLGATELLSRLNTYLDKVTEEKEKVTKPLNEALKAERARFKPMETKLEGAIQQIRSEMSRYQMALLAEKKKVEEKVAADVASGRLGIDKAVAKLSTVAVVDSEVVASSGAVKFRVDKVVRVLDKSKVPVEYVEVDLAAVKKAILAGIEVSGCVLEEVQTVVNSRY